MKFVRDGGKIREAGRKFNVPHSTLLNKLKNRVPIARKMGPPTILTQEEEELLCRWIAANAKKGIPLNKRMLIETVDEIIKNEGRQHTFTNKLGLSLPGDKWFNLFFKTHPDICQRHAESINQGRANVTEMSIRHWHSELYAFLEKENALDICNDPDRIFNSDESGFLTNPKTGLVLGPKGMKDMYEVKSGSEKECITVLITINAAGSIFPPMIVNNIILYSLLPNVTHILQPAYVSVFRSLKNNWKNVVFDWKKQNNNRALTRVMFGSLLDKAISHVSVETVKNGFRKCGLFPFNADAIDYAKCMNHETRIVGDQMNLKPSEFKVEHLLYFESVMKGGRAEEFRLSYDKGWEGDESAKELFHVWKKLRTKCIGEQTETSVGISNSLTGIINQEEHLVHNYCSTKSGNTPDKELERVATPSRSQAGEPIISTLVSSSEVTPTRSDKTKKNYISPSFLDHILWPTESPQKSSKRKKKERLPHAATSKKWLSYWEDKEKVKEQKEENKRNKVMARQQKKDQKEKDKVVAAKKKRKVIKHDTSSETEEEEEWTDSGESLLSLSVTDDETDLQSTTNNVTERCFKNGDFVLVSFPGKKSNHKYVCIVQDIFDCETEVMSLIPIDCGGLLFKTNDEDVSVVENHQILEKLETPEILTSGDRIKYTFSRQINLS